MADKAEFFYTVEQPHQWGSGPRIIYLNDEYMRIADIEEAKALAIKHQTGKPGYKDYTRTTYGVTYTCESVEKRDD
jgi:hypothetical protein